MQIHTDTWNTESRDSQEQQAKQRGRNDVNVLGRSLTCATGLAMAVSLLVGFAVPGVIAAPPTGGYPAPPAAPEAPADPQWLRQELDTFREAHNMPALAVAVVLDGKIVAASAVGQRRVGVRGGEVHQDDRFHLGSTGRLVTATLLARLVDKGRLSWSDTIDHMFPNFENKALVPAYRNVTLGDLLCHTAGLPAAPSVAEAAIVSGGGTLHQNRLAYAEAALKDAPASAPGTAVSESSAGHILAAVAAEDTTRQLYEDLMAQEVFKPLGMHTARFGTPSLPGSTPDGPWGHVMKKGKAVAMEPDRDQSRQIGAPDGRNLCLSIVDLGRFAGAHLLGASGKSSLLSDASFAYLRTPVPPLNQSPGWSVGTLEGATGPVWTSTGVNAQHFALVHVVPEEHFAICIATNIWYDGVPADCEALHQTLAAMVRAGRFAGN